MSDEKEVIKTSKRSKKQSEFAHYIYKPVIFVLMSFVFAVPVMLAVFGIGNSFISNNLDNDEFNYYDASVIDNGVVFSDVTSGSVTFETIDAFEKYGNITCESAGVNCDVYNGINRVTLRSGAGSQLGLPGCDSVVEVSGYSSTVFKNLDRVQIGHQIVFSTTYGVYTYQVSDVFVANQYDVSSATGDLVLHCNDSDGIFANYNDNELYVVATLLSGPDATEVEK